MQRVSVPGEARGAFAAASAGAALAFGGLGLFTGLAATFLVGTLHETSHALAGVTVFAMFGAGVVSQTATASWDSRRTLAAGIALMIPGMALVVLAAWLATPSLAIFMIGGAVMGAGAGALLKGSVATVVAISPAESRAEALAGLFLVGYAGLSVPVVGAGIALQFTDAKYTLLGFAILEAAAILATAPRLLGRRFERSAPQLAAA
jgi:MFS family permease